MIIDSLNTQLSEDKEGSIIVKIDPRYIRPAYMETLLGDPTKALEELGWIPQITLEEMVAHVRDKAKCHSNLIENGYDVIISKEQ